MKAFKFIKNFIRKRFLITLILSIVLSILEIEGKHSTRSTNPIILRAEQTPSYETFLQKIIRDYFSHCILVN
ncbi:MAG: hypothetical protein ACUVQ1_03965 [Candidatus Kapaibacteriales bacterium]